VWILSENYLEAKHRVSNFLFFLFFPSYTICIRISELSKISSLI